MPSPCEQVIENAAWASGRPALSVLIPFLRDDPRKLLSALDTQEGASCAELVVLDDGGADSALSDAVAAHIRALRTPVRLIRLSVNLGRAKGRNRLVASARAATLLFLDADMLPDSGRFLRRWLDETNLATAVAFGGFTVNAAPRRDDTALHRRLSLGGDCASAEVRGRSPEKHVFTSNLLIRRDVFEAEAFDEAFTGWGWEDVEWGVRASRRWPVRHIDNTATHLGLDRADALMAKYEQSPPNFARLVASHPDVVRNYAGYRAARLLRRVPLRSVWRPLLKRLTLAERAPLRVRSLAARTYRAALYADVV